MIRYVRYSFAVLFFFHIQFRRGSLVWRLEIWVALVLFAVSVHLPVGVRLHLA